MASVSVTLDAVMNVLRNFKDPESGRDFASLGWFKDLKIQNGTVSLKLILKPHLFQNRLEIEKQIKKDLITQTGATEVELKVEADMTKIKGATADRTGIPGIKHIIAVSSGKGGVGKSTVASNLAVALSKNGHAVGLLDTDVYGPNIPTMMGTRDVPLSKQDEKRGEMIIPLEAYGVKVMSMGLLTKGDQPLVWRGPMLHSVVSQFLLKVEWGNLDYLVIDMPPGTGDVQLSLTQLVPVSGTVVVTTPQEVALQDVRKAILMFEKVGVPLLGIVENMSYFTCDQCTKKHEIFGTGGGQVLAEKYKTRLLARLPLNASVREAGDQGAPIVMREPESEHAQAFLALAQAVDQEVQIMAHQAGTQSGAPVVEIGKF